MKLDDHSKKPQRLLLVLLTLGAIAAVVAGCSDNGSGSTGGTTMAHASVRLSDPATCMAPNGPYAHVYVTVSDIKAHTNANAGDNDAGFVDLTLTCRRIRNRSTCWERPRTNAFWLRWARRRNCSRATTSRYG